MELTVRPWRETDIPDLVRYWTTLSDDDAERMGCDLSRFPSAEEYDHLLRKQHAAPLQNTVSYYSMWMADGQTIGFASLKNIEFGVRGEMHLHVWDAARRGKGIGGRLFCLSALDFYERFSVRSIVCEPSAGNILPNRMLQKIGFPLAGSRYGRSSDLSKELLLNSYEITREAALSHISNGVLWDAADYAKNSQGQFGWAMSNVDKLRLQPSERVLDVGCGDGKVTAELAARVKNGSVTGVDRSEAMIVLARQSVHPPNVQFRVLDAQALDYAEDFDAVFSNSAIHWMPDQRAVMYGIARALRPGGRIFLSMGGRGTAAAPREALTELMRKSPWSPYLEGATSPHHFKGPEEYRPWLTESGLHIVRVELVHKPMRLAKVSALEGWLRTTWMTYTERIPEIERAGFVQEWARRVSERCTSTEDGALLMPMVNLEVEAQK